MDKITIERETLERAIADYDSAAGNDGTLLSWNRARDNLLALLRAALAAQPAPPAQPAEPVQPGWRDIESAPKDELILVGPTKRMGVCVAMHHSRDGWVTETCSEWMTIYTPTRWMPLPPAPKATK